MLGLIIRSFDYLDNISYIRLYKAMIRPQLEYGNAGWHPYLRKDIDSIEAVHRGSYMSAHVLLNLLNELGKKR